MSDFPQQPPTKRPKNSNNNKGFEVFVCAEESRSNTFTHAEQLRGLGVEDIACLQDDDSAIILTADKEVKQWNPSGAESIGTSLIEERIVQIAAGKFHFVAVGFSGAVYSWGGGSRGQLGHNNTYRISSPEKIAALKHTHIIQVSCGSEFTVFLSNRGEVYTCGQNEEGLTGHGISSGNELVPRQVKGLEGKKVTQVSAFTLHAAAVTGNFDLYTWGHGEDGRLGHLDEENQPTPKLVEALKGKAKQVSCGGRHTLVVSEDGLYTFGFNMDSRLGHDEIEDRFAPPMLVESLGKHIHQISSGLDDPACIVSGSLFTWGSGRGLGFGDGNEGMFPTKVETLKDYYVSKVCSRSYYTFAFVEPSSMGPRDTAPISSTFGSMVNNKDFSDVSFFVDNEQIFAWKGILVNRCPFFNAMFTSGLSETTNRHNIPISEIRKEIFLLVLQFLYTDSVYIESQDVIDLYFAADMYQLDRLKGICLTSLAKDLNVANATSMLEKASAGGLQQPKEVCMKFLVKHFGKVSKTRSFKLLRCPDLLQEVLAAVSRWYCSASC